MFLFGNLSIPESLEIAMVERCFAKNVDAGDRGLLNLAVGAADKLFSDVIEEEGEELLVVVKEIEGDFSGKGRMRTLIESRDCLAPSYLNPHTFLIIENNKVLEKNQGFMSFEEPTNTLDFHKVFLGIDNIKHLMIIDNEHYARPGGFYNVIKYVNEKNSVLAVINLKKVIIGKK